MTKQELLQIVEKKDSRYKFINACLKKAKKHPKEWVSELYLSGMSSLEITEYFKEKYNITTTARNIQDYVKRAGITRSFSDAKKLSIKKGRMVYYKKPEEEKYKAKSISNETRFMVLKRDNFSCRYCGKNREEDNVKIEIHHKKSNSNLMTDLETVCLECHRGLHIVEKKLST